MKYKVIKSVAHNLGHSFTSLMNYRADDYVMSYLARAAVESRSSELRVDLISGAAGPSALLLEPVKESIHHYCVWLPKLLESHSVQPAAIINAGMVVRLNIDRVSDDRGFPGNFEPPFECEVTLVDDRGRDHVGRVKGWWSAYHGGPPPVTRLSYELQGYSNKRSHRSRVLPRSWEVLGAEQPGR
jgi:hypothetical protein